MLSTAIIDFSDLMIGDPAWDFVYLYEDYGEEFLSTAIHAYRPAEPARQLLTSMYTWYLLALIEWVADAAEAGDDELSEALGVLARARQEHDERLRSVMSLGS